MEVGREADAWVAENIMGYRWLIWDYIGGKIRALVSPNSVEYYLNQPSNETLKRVYFWDGQELVDDGTDYNDEEDIPAHTKDITAAMQVLEQIRQTGKVAYTVGSHPSILHEGFYEATIAPRNAKVVKWAMDGSPLIQTF